MAGQIRDDRLDRHRARHAHRQCGGGALSDLIDVVVGEDQEALGPGGRFEVGNAGGADRGPSRNPE